MNKLIFASRNEGKIEEIKDLMVNKGIIIRSLLDYPEISDPVESGSTFEENALIKARAIYSALNIPTLADDSGLEVFDLNLEPGVLSARYSGEECNVSDNNRKLLKELEKIPSSNRRARFVCVLVFKTEKTETIVKGECVGTIITELRGKGGFGYDPLFVPEGFEQTFAEMTKEQKNTISHRSRGLALIIPTIQKFYNK